MTGGRGDGTSYALRAPAALPVATSLMRSGACPAEGQTLPFPPGPAEEETMKARSEQRDRRRLPRLETNHTRTREAE